VTSEREPDAADGRDQAFAAAVRGALAVDPKPTLRALAESSGTSEAEIIHFALVRWVSAGSEALLSLEPQSMKELIAARAAEDWPKVAGIIDWLEAGLNSDRWR